MRIVGYKDGLYTVEMDDEEIVHAAGFDHSENRWQAWRSYLPKQDGPHQWFPVGTEVDVAWPSSGRRDASEIGDVIRLPEPTKTRRYQLQCETGNRAWPSAE